MVFRQNARSWFWVFGAILVLSTSSARADDKVVVRRLKSYGDLSESEAKAVIDKVSQRMKLAAEMGNRGDPLRVAVSTALYDEPVPSDEAGMSMVRLRLYAGLNKWALENLFSSRSGVTKICSGESQLDADDCRALLAAAQGVRFNNVSPLRIAAQPPIADEPQPRAAPAHEESGRSRRASPGLADGSDSAPTSIRGGRRTAPSAPAVSRTAQAAPAGNTSVEQKKAEYAQRREAYLQRRREEMEARKAKIIATAGGERAQRGPASDAEAEVAGLKPATVSGRSPAIVASRSEAPASNANHDNVEDGELLEGLMDNPLGKSR